MFVGIGVRTQLLPTTSPAALFAAGEVGAWYDPSDLSTMFQDSAGTIPVTAVGQPVGLRLDKSGRGSHAAQSTPGSRAIYASVPKGGRRNIYTNTGFSGGATGTPGTAPTGWAIGFATGSITAITADAALGGNSVTMSTTAARQFLLQQFSPAAGTTWTLSADMVLSQTTQMDTIAVFASQPADATQTFFLNGAQVSSLAQVPAGAHRVAVKIILKATAGTNVQARIGIGCSDLATGSVKVMNPQLEYGSVATAYQIVRTIYDIQEAGVQTLYGLLYDGLDDFYVTPTITPGTDKVQVFAGVRKLSDAAQGRILELSASSGSNGGTFGLLAPSTSAIADYGFVSRGTVLVPSSSPASFAAPNSAVLTGIGDISGDRASLRVNGVSNTPSTSDQGSGNYLAYPIYIGRRGGTLTPYNGYEFGLIVRFGPNLSAAQIASTEAWLNTRTGAY